MIFKKNNRIVFAGDSVTDDGRERPIAEGNGLGNGYVKLIDTFLSLDYPELNLRLVNMGISGNTSRDLLGRWEEDVNTLNPDWVVVLIGINDVWRQFDRPAQPEQSVLPEEYRANLNKICDNTKAKLIFMTPYYLETNKDDAMRKRCDEYAAICKAVAEEHNIPVIDLQAAFEQILKYRYPAYITWDRVHPARIGSMIIARAFLQKIELHFCSEMLDDVFDKFGEEVNIVKVDVNTYRLTVPIRSTSMSTRACLKRMNRVMPTSCARICLTDWTSTPRTRTSKTAWRQTRQRSVPATTHSLNSSRATSSCWGLAATGTSRSTNRARPFRAARMLSRLQRAR